jgi:hypothetical protein
MAFVALDRFLSIRQVLSRQLRLDILGAVITIVEVALFPASEVPFREVNLELTNLTLDLLAIKKDHSAHRLIMNFHHVAFFTKDAHFDLGASDHLL